MAKKKTTSALKKAPVKAAAKKATKKAPARAAKKSASRSAAAARPESVEDYTMDNVTDSYENNYSQPGYSASQEEKEGNVFRLLALGIVILVLLGLVYYAFFTESPTPTGTNTTAVTADPAADKLAADKAAAEKVVADKAARVADKAPLGVEPGAKAPAGPGRDYVVKSGDTIGKIAQTQLGTQARWKEIMTLNKMTEAQAKGLKVGQTIKLPGK